MQVGQPSGPSTPLCRAQGAIQSIPCYDWDSNHYMIELSNTKGLYECVLVIDRLGYKAITLTLTNIDCADRNTH